jgi:hypothetical protein
MDCKNMSKPTLRKAAAIDEKQDDENDQDKA